MPSTCYGDTTGGSVWLADSGRFVVQTSTNTNAVIDEYGSFGVRGASQGSAHTSGWLVDDTGGTTRFSVGTDGTYYAAGTITERGSPSGTGVKIQDSGSTLKAIITTTGNVVLTGDFADRLSGLS